MLILHDPKCGEKQNVKALELPIQEVCIVSPVALAE